MQQRNDPRQLNGGKSRWTVFAAFIVLLAGLTACGGGGGDSGSSSSSSGSSSAGSGSGGSGGGGWVAGVFQPSSSFAAKCASPRMGKDPVSGLTFPDVAGTATDENNYLRSWTNELYLWYTEVPDTNPASFTTDNYFALLKTSATTPSGRPKDKPEFHFTYPTATWEQLSQAGVSVGYGAVLELLSPAPPRKLVFAFVQQGYAAANAGIARGATVLAIDGVSIDATDSGGIGQLDAGLSPAAAGEAHIFLVQDFGSISTRQLTLMAAAVDENSVPVVETLATGSGTVGYLLFNDHIATAEQQLIDAVNTLSAAHIADLVLDIRYNGGGYLDIASELAYMIAGSAQTAGRTFELVQFNDKHPSTDPVTGKPITPVAFHAQTLGFSTTAGQSLPSLNLPRVFVLTTARTCSASEAIINSLRGVNVQVIQIGSTTCGKPYGFYPQDNCGTTYFSIEFRGVNDQHFGDYADGFSPLNTQSQAGVTVPGCSVADDFGHALGDSGESLLSVALSYRMSPVCSVPPSGLGHAAVKRDARPGEVWTPAVSPFRENRILRQQ